MVTFGINCFLESVDPFVLDDLFFKIISIFYIYLKFFIFYMNFMFNFIVTILIQSIIDLTIFD
jgi:hypothetical protein